MISITRCTGYSLLGFILSFLAACGGSSSGGGSAATAAVDPPPVVTPDVEEEGITPRTRYAMASRCWAIYSVGAERYLTNSSTGYAATAETADAASPFYMKATALGSYLLFDSDGQLLDSGVAPAPGAPAMKVGLANASDRNVFSLVAKDDSTSYPPSPQFNVEPTPQAIIDYRSFEDPNTLATEYVLSAADQRRLAVDGSGGLILATATDTPAQYFSVESAENCATFPEASSDVAGVPFSGTTSNGTVLGMADVHVHISSTEFLGNGQYGSPFHRFGVTHALGDCASLHGPQGSKDTIGTAFSGDTDGHATDGWPTFTEWPQQDALTHEAIYWKWLERAWYAGLRIAVNDLVENQTLCELQKNATGESNRDCNPMNNAGRQAGTMYAMQDYIDAQYGGRGEGFFQIALSAAESRSQVEDGKLSIVLGIEISNLLNCQIRYNNPQRLQQPFEETGDPMDLGVTYGCKSTETGASDEILTQMIRLKGLGVRQIISIHEFDNAFGGNGIFDGGFLNIGNRENSGGIPTPDNPDPADPASNFGNPENEGEPPSGEFWTTYTCPLENDDPSNSFSGYLWGNAGGSLQELPDKDAPARPPFCQFAGQGGRPGGPTSCYPDTRQCNARWMTPTGLYFYSKLMELGFIFDFDHMELEMKTQALELAEAQPIAYPFVSTHGTFGGTSIDQARRVLRNGGFLYPSNGSSAGFIDDMNETLAEHNIALDNATGDADHLFGFGFGTDTNGLSSQTRPRGASAAMARPITYPYTLFSGGNWELLTDFNGINGVVFQQPVSRDTTGEIRQSWHIDEDGNAHFGMLSGFVQEVVKEGDAETLKHLFNSAEVFLQTWERTEAATLAIKTENPGGKVLNPNAQTIDFSMFPYNDGGILRAAPLPD